MTKRNLNIDMLKGLYVLLMYIDHMSKYLGNNAFYYLNGFGTLWISAAEGFIFIAGYLIGAIYLKKLKKGNYINVFKALWKKGLNLYVLSSFLIVLFAFWAMAIGDYYHIEGLSRFRDLPMIIMKAFSFRYFYGWATILSLYSIFMIIAPFILLLIKKKLTWLALLLSSLIWSLSRLDMQCNVLCVANLSVPSWQLLFILGITIGSYRNKFKKLFLSILKSKKINIIFTLVVLISLVLSFNFGYSNSVLKYMFDKRTLGLGRVLLFFVYFVVYYENLKKLSKRIGTYFSKLFITLGQNSLMAYIIQAFIVFGVKSLNLELGYIESTIVTLICISIFFTVVMFYLQGKVSIKERFFF